MRNTLQLPVSRCATNNWGYAHYTAILSSSADDETSILIPCWGPSLTFYRYNESNALLPFVKEWIAYQFKFRCGRTVNQCKYWVDIIYASSNQSKSAALTLLSTLFVVMEAMTHCHHSRDNKMQKRRQISDLYCRFCAWELKCWTFFTTFVCFALNQLSILRITHFIKFNLMRQKRPISISLPLSNLSSPLLFKCSHMKS